MTVPTPFDRTHLDRTHLDRAASTARGAVLPTRPSALDQELERFFEAESFSRTAPTRARYRRVQTRLDQFLDDVDVTRSAGTEPAARLAAERDRGRHGAFGRALGFEELLCCLEEFVAEPWLPLAVGERRTHISLTERLAQHLRRRQLIDPFVTECLYLDVLAAIRTARWQLSSGPPLSFEPWSDHWFAGAGSSATTPDGSARQPRALRLVRDAVVDPVQERE